MRGSRCREPVLLYVSALYRRIREGVVNDIWLMAFGTGGIVANIYYIQPLLASIAATFRISVAQVGAVAMLSQLGTALGMLLFVPLGDT